MNLRRADRTWRFDEDQLGAALTAWGQRKKPNGDTAQQLKAVADFLHSPEGQALTEKAEALG